MAKFGKQRNPAHRWLTRALLATLLASPAVSLAQRVQIPAAPAWGPSPTTAPAPAVGVPAPAFDPYSTAPIAPPVYSAPTGAPPAALPYTYSPPISTYGAPAAPSYDYNAPPASPGFSTEQSPLGWQSGTYGFEQNDGAVTQFRHFLARLRVEHTLLLGDNSADSFTVNRTEFASTFAIPIGGTVETPLLITPGFAFNWFDGPESPSNASPRGPDVPAQVYDAYLDFAYNPRFSRELGAELGFRTGVFSDFDDFNSDSLRFLGRGLAVVSVTPQFELLAGVVYLDRMRVKLLPAGGVRWRPNPLWDLYLVFPNPKIRKQWFSSSSADWWWYVAGEYGGGSWTINRPGLGDRVDYNDLRFVFGVEWQTSGQATGHVELGYVFDRELLFDSGMPPRAKLDDAVMFRAGIGF